LIMRHYCFFVASTTDAKDFAKIFCGGDAAGAGLGFLPNQSVTMTKKPSS